MEAVLLSTCNRVELYLACENGGAPSGRQAADFLARCHGLSPQEILDHLYERVGPEAVRHLFIVASSMDSMVVGESQILAQVKQAYQLAMQQQATGPLTMRRSRRPCELRDGLPTRPPSTSGGSAFPAWRWAISPTNLRPF